MRDRTADLLRARQALSQLSYNPNIGTAKFYSGCILCRQNMRQHVTEAQNSRWIKLVGLGGFEPPTSPLSGVRSNQLSYRPVSVLHKIR